MANKLWEALGQNKDQIGSLFTALQALALAGSAIVATVTYYRTTAPLTFINKDVQLTIVSTEHDDAGGHFYVVRAELKLENKSTNDLEILTSILTVFGDEVTDSPDGFGSKLVEKSLNQERGSRARFRGAIANSDLVYVTNEFSGWTLAVGESAVQRRAFRVPASLYNQLEANWFTVLGPKSSRLKLYHSLPPEPSLRSTPPVVCVCTSENCDAPPVVKHGETPTCELPWAAAESTTGQHLLKKTSTVIGTDFLVLPTRHKYAPSLRR